MDKLTLCIPGCIFEVWHLIAVSLAI